MNAMKLQDFQKKAEETLKAKLWFSFLFFSFFSFSKKLEGT